MNRVVASLLLLAAACGTPTVESLSGRPSDPPTASSEEVASPKTSANFHLYVSNQSFDRPTVDIEVFVDDERVVPARDFAVEGQHNWILFDLRLERGAHRLRAVSKDGNAELSRSFRTGRETWVVLDYWCCGEPEDPRFTFNLSDEPVGFA